MKIEIKIDHDFTIDDIKYHIPMGSVILVSDVINNEKNHLPQSYQVIWSGTTVLIPAFKCFEISEREKDPKKLKSLDNWFDKQTEKFFETEKNYTEIIITMKKRESYYSEWKKTITFKPEGKDKITSNDVVELKDKLDKLIQDKEEEIYNSDKKF